MLRNFQLHRRVTVANKVNMSQWRPIYTFIRLKWWFEPFIKGVHAFISIKWLFLAADGGRGLPVWMLPPSKMFPAYILLTPKRERLNLVFSLTCCFSAES